MLNKSVKNIVLSALVLLGLLVLAPQPAHATSPEDLHFQVDLVYRLGNFTGTGNWLSWGILQGSGYASQADMHAGYLENGWFLRTAHSTATLCNSTEDQCDGADDTITIRSQILNIDLVPFGPLSGDGRWVITEATGAYEGLHGNGEAHLSANFHFSCPEDTSVVGPCITATINFDGQGHFEPS